MSIATTLQQLPADYEVVIRSKTGTVEYTDRAGYLLEDDGKTINLEDFELVTRVHLTSGGLPLPAHLRPYEHGDIGGAISPPDPVVLQGPVGEWLQLVEPETEASLASLGVGVLAGLGAYIGREIKLQVGRITHPATFFAIQIGPTGTARKGTADGEIRDFLYQIDPSFAVGNIAGGFGSGESLIERVADPEYDKEDKLKSGTEDQRLYIQEGEFSKQLRIADRTGSILSDVIRLAFDGNRPLANAAKTTRKLVSSGHAISLFAGITPEELIQIFPTLAAVSGTGNRYLWVWSNPDKLLPYGGDIVDTARVATQVRANVSSLRGRKLLFAPDGKEWWEENYPLLRNPVHLPANIRPMVSRISDQVQRIALIYAATQASQAVTSAHLQAAYGWVEHSIATVRAVLGGLVRNVDAAKMLNSLRSHPGKPANKSELFGVFGRNITATAIDAAIKELTDAGLAFTWDGDTGETGGRPPTLIMATTPRVVENLQFGVNTQNRFVRSFEQNTTPEGSFVKTLEEPGSPLSPLTKQHEYKNEETPYPKGPNTSLFSVTNELTPPDEEEWELPDPW